VREPLVISACWLVVAVVHGVLAAVWLMHFRDRYPMFAPVAGFVHTSFCFFSGFSLVRWLVLP
jgi:hypothetical protein